MHLVWFPFGGALFGAHSLLRRVLFCCDLLCFVLPRVALRCLASIFKVLLCYALIYYVLLCVVLLCVCFLFAFATHPLGGRPDAHLVGAFSWYFLLCHVLLDFALTCYVLPCFALRWHLLCPICAGGQIPTWPRRICCFSLLCCAML